MNFDEEIREVLAEWDRDIEVYGIPAAMASRVAQLAARTLMLCDHPHPDRPESVTCTDAASHTPAGKHRNEDLGLTWTDDWTVHDQLGEITLLSDVDGETPSAEAARLDGDRSAAGLGSDEDFNSLTTLDVYGALQDAKLALSVVADKYNSSSKTINAPLYRVVRDAAARVEGVLGAVDADG